MTYTEMAVAMDEIQTMTATPDSLDEAVAVDWFAVAMKVHEMASEISAKVEEDIDAQYAEMIAQYDDYSDALVDAIHAGWGHD